jgi:FtsZ-interacting cell division protein ZipA
MDLNIEVIIVVVTIAILILVFTIRKNLKEKKVFEDKIKNSELGADQHKESKI